jgi:hypothetical protein
LEETKNLRQTAEQRCISLYGEECDDRTRALNEIVEDFQQQMKFYPSFSVVDTPDWSMQTETATEFKKRVQVAFDVWLRQHIAERKKEARSSGWIEVPGPRDPDHFE